MFPFCNSSKTKQKRQREKREKEKKRQNYLLAIKRKIILLAQVGLGVAKPAPLLVSQDFFAELRLFVAPSLETMFHHPNIIWVEQIYCTAMC